MGQFPKRVGYFDKRADFPTNETDSRTNRLLTLLSDEDYERLRPHISKVNLNYKRSLYEANVSIEYVYFPIDGVASLVNTMADGSAAEVGTIGNEGMVGLPILLGDQCAPTSVYVQVPGVGLKIDGSAFREALKDCPTLQRVMLRYVHAFFNQVAQSAACTHFHSLEQRCCRWVLMTHDRMPSDEFLLTQEFLAMMLGVQRASVNLAMHGLQEAGLVRYRRGHVKIIDRQAIQERACECYQISKQEFDRLLGDTPAEPRTDRTKRRISEVG